MNTQITKHSLKAKVLAIILSIMTVLSTMMSLSLTASAAYVTFNYQSAYHFKTGFQVTIEADKTYNLHQGTPIWRFYLGTTENLDDLVYCIQPGGNIYNDDNVTKDNTYAVNYWDKLLEKNSVVEKYAGRVFYYGYGGEGDVTATGGATRDDRYVATQILLWQMITNDVDEKLEQTDEIGYISNLYKPNSTGFYAAYNAIVKACKEHTAVPDFSAKLVGQSKTYTLKYNASNKRYEYTGLLTYVNIKNDFTWKVSDSRVHYQIDPYTNGSNKGWRMTLWSDVPLTSTVTVTGDRKIEGNGKIVNGIWGKSNTQFLMKSAEIDPVHAYLKVNSESTGSLNFTKKFTDNYGNAVDPVSYNIHFLIKNSKGKYLTFTNRGTGNYYYSSTSNQTAASNIYNTAGYFLTLRKDKATEYRFNVYNLPADTYTIIEYTESNTDANAYYWSSGYVVKDNKNNVQAKVQPGKTAQAGLVNTPIPLEIIKKFDGTDNWPLWYKKIRLQLFNVTDGKVVNFKKIGNNEFEYAGLTSSDVSNLYFDDKDSLYISALPMKNSKNQVITYELRETNDGSGQAGQWYTFTGVSGFNKGSLKFTLNSKNNELTVNNKTKPGQMAITKKFKYIRGNEEVMLNDSNISTYMPGKTMNDLYSALKFTVTRDGNAAKFVKLSDGVYRYSTSGNVTELSMGSNRKISVVELPYGYYEVTESNSAGLEPEKKTIGAHVSKANTTTPVVFTFSNVGSDDSVLKVLKTFKTSDQSKGMVFGGKLGQDLRQTVTFTVRSTSKNKFVTANPVNANVGYGDYTYTGLVDNANNATKFTLKVYGGEDAEQYYFMISQIPADTYEIVETMTDGSSFAQYFNVEKPKDGNSNVQIRTTYVPKNYTRTETFNNYMQTGSLTIIKYAEDDYVQREFTVKSYYKNGNTQVPVEEYVVNTVEKGQDANGKKYGSATLENLPLYVVAKGPDNSDKIYDLFYEVSETDTPPRYIVPDPQTVQLSAAGDTNVKTVTFENKLRRITINVYKLKQLIGATEEIPFAGVTFKLTNDDNDTVLTAKTDKDGNCSFENLIAQRYDSATQKVVKITYHLAEVSNAVNANFIIPETKSFKFNLSNMADSREFTFHNTEKSGGLMLYKANFDTKEAMDNAAFVVERIEKQTDGTWKVKKTYKLTYETNGLYDVYQLPMGTYRVKETTVPEGFYNVLNDKTFTLSEDQQVMAAYTTSDGQVKFIDANSDEYSAWLDDHQNGDYYYYNFPIKIDIQVYKVAQDNTKKYLSGATFVLFNDDNANGKWDQGETMFGKLTETKDSKNNPIYVIKDVPLGNYFISERKAPEGYSVITKYTKVEGTDSVTEAERTVSVLPKQNKAITQTIENAPVRGSVSIVKYDKKTEQLLAGAEFTMYRDTNENGELDPGEEPFDGKDADKKKVAQGVSSTGIMSEVSPGRFEVTDIPVGSYIVKETKTPNADDPSKPQYEPNPNTYAFMIKNKGDHFDLYDTDSNDREDEKPLGITIDGVFYPGIPNTPKEVGVWVYKYTLTNIIDRESDLKVLSLTTQQGKIVATASVADGTLSFNAETKTGEANFGTLKIGNYRLIANNDPSYIYSWFRITKAQEFTLDLSQVKTPLKGIKFGLYRQGTNELIKTAKTDRVGLAGFTGIQTGEYYIKEETVPEGYLTAEYEIVNPDGSTTFSNEYKFNITSDSTTQYVNVRNTPVKGYLAIEKVFKDEPNKTDKSGVLFHITGKTNAGNLVSIKARTNSNGMITKPLEQGTYTVTEDADYCRTHYYRQPKSQEVTITANNTKDNPAQVSFDNYYKKANIELYKYDAEYPDVKLANAQFEVYSGDVKVGTLTEDTEGHYQYVATDAATVKKNGLIIGRVYTVKETVAPDGFALDTHEYTVDLTDVKDGSTYNLETEPGKGFLNTPIKVNIQLYKVDAQNTKTYISGAVFGLYNADTDEEIGTLTEKKDSKNLPIYTFDQLRYGRYYVKEISVPDEYVLDTQKRPFIINQETVKKLAGKDVITLDDLQTALVEKLQTVKETPVLGSIIINKKDEETKEMLSGATFTLYVDSNNDGKYQSSDEVYSGLTNGVIPETDQKGVYKVDSLRYGTYFVKETKTPPGYQANNTIYKAVVKSDKDEIVLVDVDTNGQKRDAIYNQSIHNDVEIFKYDIRDLSYLANKTFTLKNAANKVVAESKANGNTINFENVAVGRYTLTVKDQDKIIGVIDQKAKGNASVDLKNARVPLKGAEFTVYTDSNTTKPVAETEYTINPVTTGADGYATFYHLNYGTYYIKETKAPANYKKSDTVFTVKVSEIKNEPQYFELNNQPNVGYYKIVKLSPDDGKVAGIKFSLKGETDTGEPREYKELTTASDGTILDRIETGTYTITELNVPEYYRPVQSQDVVVTTANDANNPATVTFTNEYKRGNVEVLKFDPDYPDTEMKGAEFTIYGKDTQGKSVSYKLKYVGNSTYRYIANDEDILTKGLIYGNYTLKETKAPYGFVKDLNTYSFSITEDGKTVNVENEAGKGFANHRIEVSIKLTKADSSTDELLKGATFALYADNEPYNQADESDTFIANLVDNQDGTYSSANKLCYGHYYVKETNAPEGYNLNEEIKFFEVAGYDDITLAQLTNGITQDLGMIDDAPITGSIIAKKIDRETGDLLSGAVFTVYADTNNNGKYDKSDKSVGTLKETKTKGIYASASLLYGKYFVIETKQPEGFEANNTIYPVTITSQGTKEVVVDVNNGMPLDGIYNTRIRNNVEVFKYDVRDLSYLVGKTLVLQNIDGIEVANSTSENTENSFGTMEAGRYIVSVAETAQIISVINLTEQSEAKIDLKAVVVPLQGAEFTIYYEDGVTPVNDPDYTTNPVVTNEYGYATFVRLQYGKYVIKETKAPANHDLSKEVIDVEITDSTSVHHYTMNNKETKRYYEIVKLSDDGKVANVKFSITGTTKNGVPVNIPEVETDENGKFKASIELGNYTITELSVPKYYRPVQSQDIEVTKANTKDNPATVTFENIHKRGNVQVIKTCPALEYEGSAYAEFKDAEFTIRGKDLHNNDFVATLSYVGNNTYKYITDDEAILSNGLIYGTYTLEETKAPKGCLRDKNIYTFKITKDGQTVTVGNHDAETLQDGEINTFEDKPIEGTLKILKVDEKNNKPLSGAQFAVYNKHTKQQVGEILVTDENGEAKTEKLVYGKYYFKEIVSPMDYQIVEDETTFVIVKNNHEVTYTVPNTPEVGSLLIHKESEDNIVEGMKFRIQGEPIDGYTTDIIVVTDEFGNARVDNLVVGEYTITEIDTPERYLQPAPQVVTVVANKTTEVEQPVEIDPENPDSYTDDNDDTKKLEPAVFENILKKGTVVVLKVDEEYPDHKLTGAEFTIYLDVDGNGQFDEGDTEVGKLTEQTGDDAGTYVYEKLVYGKYLIKETKAPENFQIDDQYYAFEITEDNQTETISNIEGDCFINKPIKGTLKITKVDKDYPDHKLSGAEFDIFADTNGNGKYDEEDAKVGVMTEDKENAGIYYSEKLRVGLYFVHETKAPQYYELDNGYYDVEITSDNEFSVSNVKAEVKDGVEITDENKVFVNKHKDIPFVLTKKDVSTGELLPDCEIEILDVNKNVIIKDKTDKNGEVTFLLQPGIYYYKEVKAPAGYILNTELHKFEIKTNDVIVKDTLTNHKPIVPPPPQTGDTATPLVVTALSLIAILSLAVLVITARKRKRK